MRRPAALFVAFVLAFVPFATARATDGTTDCPDTSTCHFPSPQQCASGNDDGVWDGGAPGHGSVCVGAAGHDIVYVGGNVLISCGTVLVADVNVIDGPSTQPPSDPNSCPYGEAVVVHDPSVAKDHGTYYLFSTGAGIPIWRSNDLKTWRAVGTVFAKALPDWAAATFPETVPWAPDISFFAGQWHVYYAISTFGSKTSAIGFATSPTLNPHDPRYAWTDDGVVVRSDNTTAYNAIDPNVYVENGHQRLTLGSAFGGLYAADLDNAGQVASSLSPVASRIGPTWVIEASFVVRRGDYYYLFASYDNCCRGSESTYNVRVGRATNIAGPYVDDQGVPMLLGGGRLVLSSDGTKRGPGHEAVLHDGDNWRLFFHYYDATTNGTARLGILPITWTSDGWPTVSWSNFSPPDFRT